MPEINMQHVVTFSSEEKNYSADNLIQSDSFKKWRCKPGEKSATVILQLPKAEQIHQIDIGNENSAFIEILVGHSASKDDDYKVIVIASSFMSPSESRNSQNGNRVRIFSYEKLSKAVCDEKWDRLKIVCTQPFNKTIAYGLSFIKCHGIPAEGETLPKQEKQMKLGAFALKPEDSFDAVKPGALFAKKEKVEPPPLTGAAAMRAASKMADDVRPSTSSAERKHSTEKKESKPSTPKTADRPPLKKQSTSLSSVASSARSYSPPPLKKARTEPSKPSREKAFHKLMDKVMFVLSGFQNPERGKLRDRAIDMGAQYKGDWGRDCSHLICAFENTPKYNQVRGKGRIVSKDWIRDCYKAKKLLPWRKYRLGRAPSPRASSSESEEDSPSPVKKKRPSTSTPTPSRAETKTKPSPKRDSSDDTDDEIQRIQQKEEQKTSPPKNGTSKPSVFDVSTDEETDNDSDGGGGGGDDGLPDLPDFFKQKTFFLYGKWDNSDRKSVRRYITAYNGTMEEYMTTDVTHVITSSQWDDNFDKALADNPNLHFVKPNWILDCYEKQKLLPHQKYVIVPN